MTSLKTGITRALRSKVSTQNPLIRAEIQRGITATARIANWTSTPSPNPQSSTPVSFPLSGNLLISSTAKFRFAHPFSRCLPTAAKDYPTSTPQLQCIHKYIHNTSQRHHSQPNNNNLPSPPNAPFTPPLLLF